MESSRLVVEENLALIFFPGVTPARKVDEMLAPRGSKCVGELDEVIGSAGVEES
jgi:hypothetical protein